jgi:hypothetical protein
LITTSSAGFGQEQPVSIGGFVEESMKQILPYIQIGMHNDEHVVVVVGDYELADFIEDYLGDDCDLPYDYRTTVERKSGDIITLHFPTSARLQEIEDSLSQLSSREVEEIYRLNN